VARLSALTRHLPICKIKETIEISANQSENAEVDVGTKDTRSALRESRHVLSQTGRADQYRGVDNKTNLHKEEKGSPEQELQIMYKRLS
jgi:hypothetical protein